MDNICPLFYQPRVCFVPKFSLKMDNVPYKGVPYKTDCVSNVDRDSLYVFKRHRSWTAHQEGRAHTSSTSSKGTVTTRTLSSTDPTPAAQGTAPPDTSQTKSEINLTITTENTTTITTAAASTTAAAGTTETGGWTAATFTPLPPRTPPERQSLQRRRLLQPPRRRSQASTRWRTRSTGGRRKRRGPPLLRKSRLGTGMGFKVTLLLPASLIGIRRAFAPLLNKPLSNLVW